jgi:hypothetical protein
VKLIKKFVLFFTVLIVSVQNYAAAPNVPREFADVCLLSAAAMMCSYAGGLTIDPQVAGLAHMCIAAPVQSAGIAVCCTCAALCYLCPECFLPYRHVLPRIPVPRNFGVRPMPAMA